MFFFVAWFVLIIQNFRVFFSVWVKFAIRYYYKSFYYFFLLFIYDCFLFCRCYFLDFLSFFSLLYFLLYLLSWEELFIFFKFYFFICFFRICRIDTLVAQQRQYYMENTTRLFDFYESQYTAAWKRTSARCCEIV